MRPFFIVPVGIAFAASAALAQENPTQTLTPPPAPLVAPGSSENLDLDEPEIALEELVRRARENSLRLQITRENLKAAQARAQSLLAFPGPTLQLVPGFFGNSTARDEQIIVAQPLDVFGLRRAQAKVGAADARRAEAENRLAARALEVEVKNAAALLFAAQEAEKLERVQVEVSQLFREAAAKRAALGDVPGVQVQRADLELLRGQNALANARVARLVQRTALNTLIGAEPNTPLRVSLPLDAVSSALLRARVGVGVAPGGDASQSTALPIDSLPAISATVGGELVAPDLGTRPDLASAQATLETRQAQVQALRRQQLPQVELQARRAPFLGRAGRTALRAVITIPLSDFGALKGQRRAAQAEVEAQVATVKLLNQRAVAQVETARAQRQNRRENVARYQKQMLPLTLDLLRKTQIGYAQGASTYLEVLEAQRALRQIQNEYLQALVGAQNSENALDAALYGGVPNLETPFENSDMRGGTR